MKILVADDHTLFRRLLVEMFEDHDDVEMVEEACDGLEAIQKAKTICPDVILMDIRMPELDGIEATRVITEELPETAVIMLTVSESGTDLMEAVRAGARGYLLKNVEPADLIRAVESVQSGGSSISPPMLSKLLDDLRFTPEKCRPVSEATDLTEREEQILQLLAKGASNKYIANELSICEATVKTHVHRLLSKLRLRSRRQAAAYVLHRQG